MMRHTFSEDFKSIKLTNMFVGLWGGGGRTDSDPPCLHYFHCIRVNVDEGVLVGRATIARINERATNGEHGEPAAETLPISDWLVTTAHLIELDQQIRSLCFKLMTLCFRMFFPTQFIIQSQGQFTSDKYCLTFVLLSQIHY